MNDFPAPFPRYSTNAAGSDGLERQVYNQVHSGPGDQQLVASDLEAIFQQRLQNLANPSSWQQFQMCNLGPSIREHANPAVQPPNGQIHFRAQYCTGLEAQEGNVRQMHEVEAPSSFHQDIQDPQANPAQFQNMDYRVGLSRFQAQELLAAHSAQIGRGPPHHLLNLPDFRGGLSTSHEHHMERIGSDRLGEQTLPPSRIMERPGETAEPRADPCKGPQVIFTVEEHPCEDQETLDGLSPLPPTPEVKVIKEVPEWAPLSVLDIRYLRSYEMQDTINASYGRL
ncbi:g6403 [Coccomyxa elongata]